MVEARTATVEGKVTHNDGREFPVELRLTLKVLPGQNLAAGDVAVECCELVSGDVPDGNGYFLEYFYIKRYREPIRVKFGRLLAP